MALFRLLWTLQLALHCMLRWSSFASVHPPQIAQAKDFIKRRFVTKLATRSIPYKVGGLGRLTDRRRTRLHRYPPAPPPLSLLLTSEVSTAIGTDGAGGDRALHDRQRQHRGGHLQASRCAGREWRALQGRLGVCQGRCAGGGANEGLGSLQQRCLCQRAGCCT